MTKDEVLKLALSTLSEVREETFRLMRDGQTLYAEDKVWSTIISIKEVLAQPQRTWVGLTQEEFEKLVDDAGFTRSDLLMIGACVEQIIDLVEAKLKVKNYD
jgi:hypothetical protein